MTGAGPRRRLGAAGVALALALGAALSVPAASEGRPAGKPLPRVRGGLLHVDAGSGRATSRVVLSRPNAVALAGGSAWVTNNDQNQGSVIEVDRRTGRMGRRIALGPVLTMVPDDVTYGFGSIWIILADSVYRLTPGQHVRRQLVAGIPSHVLLSAIAVGSGAVWAVDATNGLLLRIDPRSTSVTQQIRVGDSADGLAAGAGAIWVTSSAAGTLARVAPRSGSVTRTVRIAGAANGVAAGGGSVWVTSTSRDAVARVSAATGRVRWIHVGRAPSSVALAGRFAWVVDSFDHTLVRIDAHTGRVLARIPVPTRPYWVAADSRGAWLTFLGPTDPQPH